MSDPAQVEPVKIGLLEKRNPDGSIETSLGRVLMALVVIGGLGIGLYAVASGKLDSQTVNLVLGLVAIGSTGKVVSGGLEGRK